MPFKNNAAVNLVPASFLCVNFRDKGKKMINFVFFRIDCGQFFLENISQITLAEIFAKYWFFCIKGNVGLHFAVRNVRNINQIIMQDDATISIEIISESINLFGKE